MIIYHLDKLMHKYISSATPTWATTECMSHWAEQLHWSQAAWIVALSGPVQVDAQGGRWAQSKLSSSKTRLDGGGSAH